MGLELPPELREALSWVGVFWPEADETALLRCGEYWGTFAEQAAGHAEAATAAVAAMLEENSAESLDAFARYWEKVVGQDGYVADCGIVAGAVSVAFYSAGGLVLTLKLAVIAQLVAYAVILAAAIAAAIPSAGTSLVAAAEIATVVNRTITTFVTSTITAIQQLGVPLSQLAATHLGEQISRLAGRPIHSSPDGVHDFKTPEERAANDPTIYPSEPARPDFENPTFDDRKLTEYVLNPDHPDGKHKARVIESATGLGRDDAATVKQQILEQVQDGEPVPGKVDEHGARWAKDVILTGPKGTIAVRTAWIVDAKTGETRLVTVSFP